MRRQVLAVVVLAAGCGTSEGTKPTPERVVDEAPARTPVVDAYAPPPEHDEYVKQVTAEVAAGVKELDETLGRETTAVRFVRTGGVAIQGVGLAIFERCRWRMLDRAEIEALRAAVRELAWYEPPACAFNPTFRLDVITPERTRRIDVCLGCSQIKSKDFLDFHFFQPRGSEPGLELWAKRTLIAEGAGDIAYEGAFRDAIDLREPLPCPP